jgi:hypothetical protein
VVDFKFLFLYFTVNKNSCVSRVHGNIASQVGGRPGCTRSQCEETGLNDLDPQ